jgi:hypothetical protein
MTVQVLRKFEMPLMFLLVLGQKCHDLIAISSYLPTGIFNKVILKGGHQNL